MAVYGIQLLEGAASVAIGAAVTAYVADFITEDKRGWAMSVYQQTICIACRIGQAFGLLSELIGFRTIFLVGASLEAVGFSLVLLLVKEPHRHTHSIRPGRLHKRSTS